MVFKLKPSIQITKGKYRDLLCEVQTQFVSFVPTSLTRFLNEYNGKIDLDALESKYKKSEFYDIYKEYLEYLIENKLLLFTSENISVQRIKFEYVEKSTFNNMIIYLDFNSDFLNYEKINDIIIKCNIISLELRVINFVDIKKYLSFTTLLNSTYISNIHLVDTKNSVSKYNCQEILERCMKTNKITKFECTSDDIETFINKYGTYNINLKQGSIFDSKFDVKVDNSHANLRYISEALVRNVYFNNKLVIGYDGKIYNNEYLEGCCIGNIFDNNNKLDDKGSDLGIWRVTKGSIKKCKDCELRNLCLDRRTPVVNEKGKYYYASDCGYNLKEENGILYKLNYSILMPFPFTHQLDAMDCGPACLKMITDHHGRVVSLQKLREKCHISREGVSLAGISTSMRSMIYCCGSTSSVSQTHHLTDAADSTDF